MNPIEEMIRFHSLGGTVTIYARGIGAPGVARDAELAIREIQDRLTRFETDSELCELNRNAAPMVPASPLMLRLAEAVGYAGELSDGLVDATLLDEVERAGYTRSMVSGGANQVEPVTGEGRRPAHDSPSSRRNGWRTVSVDHVAGTVSRPPGVRIDSGGLGKGMAADVASEILGHLDHFSVECSGDLRFGGHSGEIREIEITSPFDLKTPIAWIDLDSGAVATSGTTKRSWTNPDGEASHHLIDPRTGRPASTGLTQATAVAPTALEAEIRAKSALLSGPEGAAEWLVNGGAVVTDDGTIETFGNVVEMKAFA